MTQTSKPVQNHDNKLPSKSPREIENEIGETRGAIASDIKELNSKFSSANVKETAKDVLGGVKDAAVEQAVEMKDVVLGKAVEVKDAVVEKAIEVKDVAAEKMTEAKEVVIDTLEEVGEQAMRAGSASWRFTKANAVPLALFGAGAAWLVANNRRSRDRGWETDGKHGPGYEGEAWGDDEAVSPPRRRAASDLSGRPTQARSRPKQGAAMSKAAAASSRIGARAHELMDEAGEGMQRAEHAITDGASRSVDYVQEQVRRAGTASRDFAAANPLLIATASLAVGIGVGMLLPSSDGEDRLLAPSRAKFQHLIGDVKEAATDVARVAKDTANESINALT